MTTDARPVPRSRERGSSLIIVILIMAFMIAGGVSLLTVTGTGPAVSTNILTQDGAFNAAEAGFDAAYNLINDYFLNGVWDSFDGHYLTSPAGIDQPLSTEYFRTKTDDEILAMLDAGGDGVADYAEVLFFKEPFARTPQGTSDARYGYTVFLLDNEAGGTTSNPKDVLMVCIGTVELGGRRVTDRLEIVIAIE